MPIAVPCALCICAASGLSPPRRCARPQQGSSVWWCWSGRFPPARGGIVTAEVRAALAELDRPPQVHGFAVGLGGRDVPLDLLPRLLANLPPRPGPFRIFDLDVQKLPEGGS